MFLTVSTLRRVQQVQQLLAHHRNARMKLAEEGKGALETRL